VVGELEFQPRQAKSEHPLEVLQTVDPTFKEVPDVNDPFVSSRYRTKTGYNVEFMTPNRGSHDHHSQPASQDEVVGRLRRATTAAPRISYSQTRTPADLAGWQRSRDHSARGTPCRPHSHCRRHEAGPNQGAKGHHAG
jgi:Nucleotidyltransferase